MRVRVPLSAPGRPVSRRAGLRARRQGDGQVQRDGLGPPDGQLPLVRAAVGVAGDHLVRAGGQLDHVGAGAVAHRGVRPVGGRVREVDGDAADGRAGGSRAVWPRQVAPDGGVRRAARR